MRTTSNAAPRADIYETVTNNIIASIEAGAGEWRMPWHLAGGVQPVNVASNKHYRGINMLALWVSDQINGFGSSVWGTYRQWDAVGAQVRKGSKSTPIVFWKPLSQEDKDQGEDTAAPSDRPRFVARGFHVFNATQVEGWDLVPVLVSNELQRIDHADAFISSTGAEIRHGGSRAYYSPTSDHIQMPQLMSFDQILPYYSTLLHELTHWSGSKNRCDRDLSGRFGDKAYAAEELIAELGAAFLCSSIGLAVHPRPDHAQYIQNWLQVLKSDKRAIFTAAGLAQRAADYLHSLRHETDVIEADDPDYDPVAVAACFHQA